MSLPGVTVVDGKSCMRCGDFKSLAGFYTHRGRHRSACILCYADHNREMRVKHSEKRNEYDRSRGNGWKRSGRAKWDISERDKHDKYLRRTYGISIEEFDAMHEAQEGKCAICRDDCNRSTTKRFCVDHDHTSGEVRGLLCFQCNVGLGKFKDNPSILSSAIDYLERRKHQHE